MKEITDVYGRAVQEKTRKEDYQEIARKLATDGHTEDYIRNFCSKVLSEEEITEAIAGVKVPG